MSSSTAPGTKVGILSIGDMGEGIAKLLVATGFKVATNGKGRSEDTLQRARNAQVELLSSDIELVQQCAVILSVVPPRDAIDTAQRITDALAGSERSEPLYFADMNAVAPSTCRKIAEMFERAKAPVRFIDGCILGAPPYLKSQGDPGTNNSVSPLIEGDWYKPGLPMSGPYKFSDSPIIGQKLFDTLGINHISDDIGAASGLKMCFASFSKGHIAIAIQSFTTAHRLGVLEHLKKEMSQRMPVHLRLGDNGSVIMAPKAYRWVREMEEINATFAEDGGFDSNMFQGAAGIYKTVAEDTVLGQEKIGKRKRGTTANDVAAAMAEGLEKKKKKTE